MRNFRNFVSSKQDILSDFLNLILNKNIELLP